MQGNKELTNLKVHIIETKTNLPASYTNMHRTSTQKSRRKDPSFLNFHTEVMCSFIINSSYIHPTRSCWKYFRIVAMLFSHIFLSKPNVRLLFRLYELLSKFTFFKNLLSRQARHLDQNLTIISTCHGPKQELQNMLSEGVKRDKAVFF